MKPDQIKKLIVEQCDFIDNFLTQNNLDTDTDRESDRGFWSSNQIISSETHSDKHDVILIDFSIKVENNGIDCGYYLDESYDVIRYLNVEMAAFLEIIKEWRKNYFYFGCCVNDLIIHYGEMKRSRFNSCWIWNEEFDLQHKPRFTDYKEMSGFQQVSLSDYQWGRRCKGNTLALETFKYKHHYYLTKFLKENPKITRLNLKTNPRIQQQHEFFQAIIRELPKTKICFLQTDFAFQEHFDRLIELPLTGLSLNNIAWLDDHAIQLLAKSPTLTDLSLIKISMGLEAYRALGQSPGLKTLSIEDTLNPISLAEITALSVHASLTSLNLGHNQLQREETIKPLLAMPSLVELNLSYVTFNANTGKKLFLDTLSHFKKMNRLHVSGNDIQADEWGILLSNPSLIGLIAQANHLSIKAIRAFNESQLIDLDLSNSNLTDSEVQILAQNTAIKQLNLSFNKIGTFGALALSKNQNIEVLNLSHNKIELEGAIVLAAMKKVTSLNLSFNEFKCHRNFAPESEQLFAAFQKNQIITQLEIETDPLDFKYQDRLNYLIFTNRKRLMELKTSIRLMSQAKNTPKSVIENIPDDLIITIALMVAKAEPEAHLLENIALLALTNCNKKIQLRLAEDKKREVQPHARWFSIFNHSVPTPTQHDSNSPHCSMQ